MLYKIASETFPCFPSRKCEKTLFFEKDTFLLEFPKNVVIWEKIWLAVGIKETALNNDGESPRS